MKKLLLVLAMILSVIVIPSCEKREEPEGPIIACTITDLDSYDYYLLVVVSRQRLSQNAFMYVLHEADTLETSDDITYISDELWSVGEFVIAIELDEECNVYYTDLNVTIDMIAEYWHIKEQVEMQSLYNELKLDYYEERYGVDLDDTPEDFEKFLYNNYRELYNYMEDKER